MRTSSDSVPARVRKGRPRDEAARQAILDTAMGLFRSGGLAAVTMERVAAESGVAKTTIYRWWPNKAAVLLEGVAVGMMPLPEHGKAASLRDQFKKHLLDTSRYLGSAKGAPVIALIAAKQADPDLMAAFSKRYAGPRRKRLRELLEGGVERGVLRSIPDVDLVIDQLYGPLYYRLLVTCDTIDRRFIDAVVNHVFDYLET